MQEHQVAEEGSMKVFNAESVDLSHLDLQVVEYAPKNIITEALQITQENIGKLSLEFEEELFFDQGGRPYFVFTAERLDGTQVDPAIAAKDSIELYVRLTDWIVPLRGELHIFRDLIFQHTFSIGDTISEDIIPGFKTTRRALHSTEPPFEELPQSGYLNIEGQQ